MEDAHIVDLNIDGKGTAVFGVFDGHGGTIIEYLINLGSEVATFCHSNFITQLKANDSFKSGDYAKALEETFLAMDKMMKSNESSDQRSYQYSDAGCTANVVLVTDKKIYCANAGDSRSVISVGKQAHQLSEDHKPDSESEKNRIEKAGGYVMGGRTNGVLSLSRAIGDFDYKDMNKVPIDHIITAVPDVTVRDITPDTEFIICACDGIWDCLSPQESVDKVHEKLAKSNDLKKNVEELLDSIIAEDVGSSGGIGCDNMTCFIIQFKH
jgi:serine/threonine protein phosphatase PrpC